MKIVGSTVILMALAIALIPQFSDCRSQGHAMTLAVGGTVPMKCHWTAEAELALSGILFPIGVLILVCRRRETLRALSILAVIAGVVAILIPSVLIGVCLGDRMLCNLVMRPALILSGIAVIGAGIAGLAFSVFSPAQARSAAVRTLEEMNS